MLQTHYGTVSILGLQIADYEHPNGSMNNLAWYHLRPRSPSDDTDNRVGHCDGCRAQTP